MIDPFLDLDPSHQACKNGHLTHLWRISSTSIARHTYPFPSSTFDFSICIPKQNNFLILMNRIELRSGHPLLLRKQQATDALSLVHYHQTCPLIPIWKYRTHSAKHRPFKNPNCRQQQVPNDCNKYSCGRSPNPVLVKHCIHTLPCFWSHFWIAPKSSTFTCSRSFPKFLHEITPRPGKSSGPNDAK